MSVLINDDLRKVDPKYQEILKAHRLLDKENIVHILKRHDDGWQILIDSLVDTVMFSAVESYGTYRYERDLIEVFDRSSMGAPLGGYTAEGVVRLAKEYLERKIR